MKLEDYVLSNESVDLEEINLEGYTECEKETILRVSYGYATRKYCCTKVTAIETSVTAVRSFWQTVYNWELIRDLITK